ASWLKRFRPTATSPISSNTAPADTRDASASAEDRSTVRTGMLSGMVTTANWLQPMSAKRDRDRRRAYEDTDALSFYVLSRSCRHQQNVYHRPEPAPAYAQFGTAHLAYQ